MYSIKDRWREIATAERAHGQDARGRLGTPEGERAHRETADGLPNDYHPEAERSHGQDPR